MIEIIIKAKNLCKSYSCEGVQNHVLRNIDLEIHKGVFTVIMGSSGSGKSTLLYNLSGMDLPTSGQVSFGGRRIDNIKEKELAIFRRSEVGFVFQQIHLVSNLSIYENITVPGYLLKRYPRKEIEKRAMALLESIGIKELKTRLPSQVSGGQQQRAAIGRALINEPNLLFADEPTGALNSKVGREILNILTEVNKSGQSILMVTHDVKAAVRADRIIFLHDGQIEGEINLEKYMPDSELSREKQVLSWLTSKGW
ncbi:MAG: ABC transporter ATP-binding protein [Clostridiaceae bacterium]|nr:ABC transporter ATP-binding protein [Clostridiaceae bacterium]